LFAQALAIVSHLSLGGFSGIVYEHFLGCFILEDSSLGFSKLLQTIIRCGHIPRSVALMLGLADYWQWQKTMVVFILWL